VLEGTVTAPSVASGIRWIVEQESRFPLVCGNPSESIRLLRGLGIEILSAGLRRVSGQPSSVVRITCYGEMHD
jgi:hypothetical protein